MYTESTLNLLSSRSFLNLDFLFSFLLSIADEMAAENGKASSLIPERSSLKPVVSVFLNDFSYLVELEFLWLISSSISRSIYASFCLYFRFMNSLNDIFITSAIYFFFSSAFFFDLVCKMFTTWFRLRQSFTRLLKNLIILYRSSSSSWRILIAMMIKADIPAQ